MYSKGALIEMAREHWKEFQPKKTRGLKRKKQLEQELQSAAKLTLQAMKADLTAGFSPHEAWEMERENYILLRAEDGLGREDRLPGVRQPG